MLPSIARQNWNLSLGVLQRNSGYSRRVLPTSFSTGQCFQQGAANHIARAIHFAQFQSTQTRLLFPDPGWGSKPMPGCGRMEPKFIASGITMQLHRNDLHFCAAANRGAFVQIASSPLNEGARFNLPRCK